MSAAAARNPAREPQEIDGFVTAGGLAWRVRLTGEGPVLLLIHGTGASGHSWDKLVPALAKRLRVIVIDLPGHGETAMPPAGGLALPAMARGIATLLAELGEEVALVAGHSAGAAIAVRMMLEGLLTPKALISINGAFKPYGGVAAQIFSPMAKMMFLNPFVPRFFAWRAGDQTAVERLIEGTGSHLDAEGIARYQRLFARHDHVEATLGMMAHWDLAELWRDLGRVTVPVLLVIGEKDIAVSPEEGREAKARFAQARVALIANAGHLAHEEKPADIARLILAEAERAGVLAPRQAGERAP